MFTAWYRLDHATQFRLIFAFSEYLLDAFTVPLILGSVNTCRVLVTKCLWDSFTPLGKPVVPLEYGSTTTLPGLGLSSAASIDVSVSLRVISRKLTVPCGIDLTCSPGVMISGILLFLSVSTMLTALDTLE